MKLINDLHDLPMFPYHFAPLISHQFMQARIWVIVAAPLVIEWTVTISQKNIYTIFNLSPNVSQQSLN